MAACCARAVIGHEAAAPPSADMNCRLPMPTAIERLEEPIPLQYGGQNITHQSGGLASTAPMADDRRVSFRVHFRRAASDVARRFMTHDVTSPP